MSQEIRTFPEIKKMFEAYRAEMLEMRDEAKSHFEKEIKLLQNQVEQISIINKQTARSIKSRKTLQDLLDEFTQSIDTVTTVHVQLAQECCDFYPKVLEHLEFSRTSNLWDGRENVRAERIKESEAAVIKYSNAFDEIVAAGKPQLQKRFENMKKVLVSLYECA